MTHLCHDSATQCASEICHLCTANVSAEHKLHVIFIPIEYNLKSDGNMSFIRHQCPNENTKFITYLCHDRVNNESEVFSNVSFKCHLKLKNSPKVYHFCTIEYLSSRAVALPPSLEKK